MRRQKQRRKEKERGNTLANTSAEDIADAAMKKPAAVPTGKGTGKGMKLAHKIERWRQGLTPAKAAKDEDGDEGEEEEVEDDEDEEVDPESDPTARDRGKARQFQLQRGSLPQHILTLYDQAANKASPRNLRTLVINRLFTKDSKGKPVGVDWGEGGHCNIALKA